MVNKLHHKVLLNDFLFFSALNIWLIYSLLGITTIFGAIHFSFDRSQLIVIAIVSSLLVVKIVVQAMSQKQAIIVCSIIIVAVTSSVLSHSIRLFMIALFVSASKDIDVTKIVKRYWFIYLFVITLATVLALTGIIPNYILIFQGDRSRTALGFLHPNALGAAYLVLATSWLVIRWRRLSIIDVFGLSLLGLVVNFVANSRTSAILILLLVVLATGKLLYRNFQFRGISAAALLSVLGTLTLGTMFNQSVHFWATINRLTSNRALFTYVFFQRYQLTFLGQTIERFDGTGFEQGFLLLDSSWARFFVQYGIFPLIILLLAYFLFAKNFGECENYSAYAIAMLPFIVVGLTESYNVSIVFNFSLFYFSYLIFGHKDFLQSDDFFTNKAVVKNDVRLLQNELRKAYACPEKQYPLSFQ